MTRTIAKVSSAILSVIARYFVQTASPSAHRPEIPEELKKD